MSILDLIPTFKCKPGCSDCCLMNLAVKICANGDLITNGTWFRIGKIGAVEQLGKCMNATPSGCTNYNRRGFLCRLYGASEMLPDCPHGYGAQRKLTIEETREIILHFNSLNQLACPIDLELFK